MCLYNRCFIFRICANHTLMKLIHLLRIALTLHKGVYPFFQGKTIYIILEIQKNVNAINLGNIYCHASPNEEQFHYRVYFNTSRKSLYLY